MNSNQFGKLKGWVDYDRPFLSQLTYKQKIIWLRRRLNLTLIKPLKYVYRGVSRSSQQSALLILATIICCAIEAMGKFYIGGRGDNHSRFNGFLRGFMHSDFMSHSIQGMKYGDILWYYFRNGLAHGFAICHGGFEYQDSYFSVKINGLKETLLIDPKNFLDDFLNGVKKYLDALHKSSPTKDKVARDFEKVFKSVFIDGK
jgi:hypothetical protein